MWRHLVGNWKMWRSSHHPDWGKAWNGFKKGHGGREGSREVKQKQPRQGPRTAGMREASIMEEPAMESSLIGEVVCLCDHGALWLYG